MVDNVSIAAFILPMRILTLFSADEILLRKYGLSTNFRDLPYNEEMDASYSWKFLEVLP